MKAIRYSFYFILFCVISFQLEGQLEAVSTEQQEDQEERERFDIEISNKRSKYPYLLEYVVWNKGQWTAVFQDQSVWVLEDCRDEDFIAVASLWQQGDEIRLYPRNPKTKKGKWILKNLSNDTVFYGHLKSAPDPALQIDIIDTQGYFIKLSDSSFWTVGWLHSWTSWHWKPDQKVLINAGANSYLLINCEDKRTWIFAHPTKWQ